MSQAVGAYRSTTDKGAPQFKEFERLRSLARHNEASALEYAEKQGRAKERVEWQSVVADKDAEIARLRAQLGGNK